MNMWKPRGRGKKSEKSNLQPCPGLALGRTGLPGSIHLALGRAPLPARMLLLKYKPLRSPSPLAQRPPYRARCGRNNTNTRIRCAGIQVLSRLPPSCVTWGQCLGVKIYENDTTVTNAQGFGVRDCAIVLGEEHRLWSWTPAFKYWLLFLTAVTLSRLLNFRTNKDCAHTYPVAHCED